MYISISCITAFYGFRPYGGSLLSNSHKSKQKGLAPCVRLSLRSSSLAPVPLRGHAVTGHPWPNTALPASMPVDPLRRTSTRPPERGGRSRSKTRSQTDHKQITNRSQTDHKQIKTLWRCSSCSHSLQRSHISVHQVKPFTRFCEQLSPTELQQHHPYSPHRGKTHR